MPIYFYSQRNILTSNYFIHEARCEIIQKTIKNEELKFQEEERIKKEVEEKLKKEQEEFRKVEQEARLEEELKSEELIELLRLEQESEFCCQICNKILLSNSSAHECFCIFCRLPFPSNFLSEHHILCTTNSLMECHHLENIDAIEEENRRKIIRRTTVASDNRGYDMLLQNRLQNSNSNSNLTYLFRNSKKCNRSLKEDEIKHIPETKYKNFIGEIEKCMICIDDLKENDIVRSLGCLHKYHSTCIAKWLATKNECPLCKNPVNFDKNNNFC